MSLLRRHFLSLLACTSTIAMSAADAHAPTAAMAHVAWSRRAAIYQVNVRQFSAEGTLKAAQAELPRLAALNYDRPALRDAMIAAMQFWLHEVDLDGFRCDVASLVPTTFWERARRELDAVKPVFMLAESDAIDLHRSAFDMTYSWDLARLFHEIGQGRAGASDLRDWARQEPHGFAPSAYRMRFTSNHDFNSWNGTDAELYGDHYLPLAVLTFTLPGMPLIYNGQETRLTRRLAFFEKDPIAWQTRELQPFYAELLALKHAHPALANGQYGGALTLLEVGNECLFAFTRSLATDKVTVVVNLSASEQALRLGKADRSLPAHGWLIESA